MTDKTSGNFSDPLDSGTLRILDAAWNRALEGLRVVEDYARWVLNDGHLTERLKTLRHQLVSTGRSIPTADRILSRDTLGDVGTEISLPSENRREAPAGIIQANLARVQQALRTLEEYSKLQSAELAQAWESSRYETYTLEKSLLTTFLSQQHLRNTHLYVLTDGRNSLAEFRQHIASLVAAGVDLIQLRDKSLTARELMGRSEVLNELCRPAQIRWIMNDRADLAVACQADGVHLGQDDLTVSAARKILGPAKLIGVSTHHIDQARAAVLAGANYIGVGPIFFSRTKSFRQTLGLDYARAVAAEIQLPAFAIGGIQAENLTSVLETGIQRVAVSGAINQASDPGAMVKWFKSHWSTST